MPYTTYDFYAKDFYGDLIPQESFSKFEYKARNEIDRFTFGRLKGLRNIPHEAQACVCEIAEYVFKEDQKQDSITSESTDGYSVTYQKSKGQTSVSKELYQIAIKHLSQTGLLYRGFTC